MLNVLTVITAHTSRHKAAAQLAIKTNAAVFMDDGALGEPGNTRRALRWAEQQKASHVIVLQDDALPVNGFMGLAVQAITERPEHVISYYLGTGRPNQNHVAAEVQQAEQDGADWIDLDRLYWGVAWSTPLDLLPAINAWLREHTGPTDRDIGAWMKANHPACSYVWPSLVDHTDGPSLVYQQRLRLERKAWKVRTTSTGALQPQS